MAKNNHRDGDTMTIIAAAALTSGSITVVGGVAGLVTADIALGAQGDILCFGVVKVPSASATTGSQGGEAYITPGGLATSSSSGNTKIGRFWEPKVDGQTVAYVKLNA